MGWFKKKKTKQPPARKAPAQGQNPNVRPAVATHKGWQAGSTAKQERLAERLKTSTPPGTDTRGTIESGIRPRISHSYSPDELLKLFLREDCSWCRKFYTHPSECPSNRYDLERCELYEQLEKESRSSLIESPRWQVVIREVMSKKVSPLPTRKCHYCGKLNPEPESFRNWKCINCGSKL
ncbi:MAG: hypothetical protein WC333_06770 [Dehalococcoidia bacterium]|jgi:hypothetical protein